MNTAAAPVEIVVDTANVVGSRPDGWWRDRAAAATRLVQALSALPGTVLPEPEHRDAVRRNGSDGADPTLVPPAPPVPGLRIHRVLAVVEGQARQIPQVDGVSLVRATADGDGAVVTACRSVLAGGGTPLAVTADRALRARLPEGTVVAGPRWLWGALDQSRNDGSAAGTSTSI
jgi:hypothetical protein